jgi:hypothetical protein
MMGKIPFQSMQPVAGCIHVLRHAGYVKSGKKSTKTIGMFWLIPALEPDSAKHFSPLCR